MDNLDKIRKVPSHKAFGVEIECYIDWSVDTPPFIGFFQRSHDGSLRDRPPGHAGWEFVSQPLTFDWMMREIDKLYKKLGYSDIIADTKFRVNSTCGIHVHVNREWCSQKKAKAIQNFVCSLSDYEFEDLFGRMPNQYCRTSIKTTRYCAVNTTNKATVEFRMFKSGGPDWAKYCVSMARYLVENAYHLNIDAIMAFRSINHAAFKESTLHLS